jgi:hypothetical protein
MSNPCSRRWFQLSLKSLFLLVLLAATFLGGYTLATKQAEAERRRAEIEAQRALEEARQEAEAQARQAQWEKRPGWASPGATWRAWTPDGQVVPQAAWTYQPQQPTK